MKKIFSTIAITLLTKASMVNAQSMDFKKLDAYMDSLAVHNKFMGSLAISKNGQILYTRSVGYANLETKQLANENTIYRIGSISKTFTAVLVLKAIEEKKLKLTETLSTYFPEIKNAKKISIHHLLNHRSGIHNFTDDESYLGYNTEAKTQAEMLTIIKAAGSDFEPNSQSAYSNSNYILLSYILEKVYEKSYRALLNEKIITPLNLQRTSTGTNINNANNECNSYSYNGSWAKETETDLSIPMGAGNIISTSSDLIKFADALFSNKLLTPSSLTIMKTITDKFGLGLFQIPFNNEMGYGHTGGIDGFSSVFVHFDKNNTNYALTCNGTNLDNNQISIAALSAVNGMNINMPNFQTIDVDPQDLKGYEGVYASKEMPLKITISSNGKTISAQATGQGAFELDAVELHKFKFDVAAIEMLFEPSSNTLFMSQGGKKYTFTKE